MSESLGALLRAQLTRTLETTDFPGLGERYEGKVRDCYVAKGRRTIIVTDRISAFDRVLGTIPFKGQVLNQMAAHWFDKTEHIAPNHVLAVPDPNITVARECTPLPAEFVVRGYLTGVTSTSIWRAYERGDRSFCGHALPDGMTKNQKLPTPLLTPSTKAPKGGHDESVSRATLLERGGLSAADFDRAGELAMALFAFGQEQAAARGLVLADAKYEMGKTDAGEICIIDEMHTPDSSRYWFADDLEERVAKGLEPRSMDKEFVRRWLAETKGYTGDGPTPPLSADVRVEAARRYIETFELMTGETFVPDPEPPRERMARNLENAR